jgi:RNA polymerase sigma factor (sigma-70 family)
MVRPLTRCRKDGRRYERPPEIEAKIAVALRQPLPVVIERAAIGDRTAENYLPTECLVHLVRDARRRDDQRKVNDLIPLIFNRCERIVGAKLSRDRYDNPDPVVDEALERLGEVFAIDSTENDKHKLDFYEIAFKKAVLALCINALNKELKHAAETVSLTSRSDDDDSGAHDSLMAQIDKLKVLSTEDNGEAPQKLRAAVEKLPPDEREAIVLVYYLGHEVESNDKTKETAATICGVSGRTIFSRLARAYKKLAQIMEEP